MRVNACRRARLVNSMSSKIVNRIVIENMKWKYFIERSFDERSLPSMRTKTRRLVILTCTLRHSNHLVICTLKIA